MDLIARPLAVCYPVARRHGHNYFPCVTLPSLVEATSSPKNLPDAPSQSPGLRKPAAGAISYQKKKRRALPGSCYLLERDTRHFRVPSVSSIAQPLCEKYAAPVDSRFRWKASLPLALSRLPCLLSTSTILPANLSHMHFLLWVQSFPTFPRVYEYAIPTNAALHFFQFFQALAMHSLFTTTGWYFFIYFEQCFFFFYSFSPH